MMYKRYIAIRLAKRFIGVPYYWGGDDPMQGFDCSGLAVEMLKSVGLLPKRGDWNARTLATMFPKVEDPRAGCLVFFGAPGEITHVGICINKELMIEAGGGGRDTKDLETAIARNAYIRMRPIKSRTDITRYVDPFK